MKYNYQSHANKPGIYKITNTHSNRIYIGQAKRLKERWASHSAGLRSNKHQNKFLQNDFNKCKEELGHDDFLIFEVIEVMEGSTKEERNKREEWWISQRYDNQDSCYNFKQKVEGKERSCYSNTPEETKRKQSESMKKRWQDPEYAASIRAVLEENLSNPEVKQKLSEARREAWSDPAYKASMSEKIAAAKGTEESRAAVSEFMTEFKNTPEERARISERSKANWNNPEYRAAHREAMIKATSSQEYKEKQRQGFLKRKEDTEAWIAYQKQASEHAKKLHASGIMAISEETKKKMSEAATKRHAEGRGSASVATQFKPKEYELIAPNGEIIKIDNLRLFCAIHDLDYQLFRRVAAGSRKEYAGYHRTVSRKPRTSSGNSWA